MPRYTPRISDVNVKRINEIHDIMHGGEGDRTSVVNAAIFFYHQHITRISQSKAHVEAKKPVELPLYDIAG